MGEICIPMPSVEGGQKADITISTTKNSFNYRVECFSFSGGQSPNNEGYNEEVFDSLKNRIENYDGEWELMQVFAPEGNDNLIKVLYRQR